MGMVPCSACGTRTLNAEGKCQHCGALLTFKSTILRRKLRRNEAYGVLMIVTGFAMLLIIKFVGVLMILGGATWIVSGLIKPRV